jgi:hypothetical protein
MAAQTDEELISRAGHACFDDADALSRIVADLHKEPVTRADLILGNGLPTGLRMQWWRDKLAKADALLKLHPKAEFIMHAYPTGLEYAVEHFRQAVQNAERYADDRRR